MKVIEGIEQASERDPLEPANEIPMSDEVGVGLTMSELIAVHQSE